MQRRSFLRAVGVGAAAAGTGCLGLGGEVVVSVQQSVSVQPGSGWVQQVPDVSDPGGAVSYIARSDDGPFAVYFFVGREQFEPYEQFTKGNEPEERPSGYRELSKVAVPREGDEGSYQAATNDEGARESLDKTGPYFFVVDYSNYRMENSVEEFDEPLSVFVDLEVTRKRIGV